MNALPLVIPDYPIMDDERLYKFCIYNREIKIERKSTGELSIMSPTGGETGNRNFKLLKFLGLYADKNPTGVAFDSSTGFILPNKAMLSPDAAWIQKEKWEHLTSDERKKFPPICPDFVIELMSESDILGVVQGKMLEWIENGCRLAWLIDPFDKKAYIYRSNGEMQVVSSFEKELEGEDVLPGLRLPLKELI